MNETLDVVELCKIDAISFSTPGGKPAKNPEMTVWAGCGDGYVSISLDSGENLVIDLFKARMLAQALLVAAAESERLMVS